MEIINYFECDNREHWLTEIKKSDWGATPTLVGFLENGTFFENLGDGVLLLLTDGGKLVSFVTFARNDCIDDKSLYPWIGFVFTFPEYRGHRYVGRLIERCEKIAREHSVGNIPSGTSISVPIISVFTKSTGIPILKTARTSTVTTAEFTQRK